MLDTHCALPRPALDLTLKFNFPTFSQLCNACGLYERTHAGKQRPERLIRRPFTKRRRSQYSVRLIDVTASDYHYGANAPPPTATTRNDAELSSLNLSPVCSRPAAADPVQALLALLTQQGRCASPTEPLLAPTQQPIGLDADGRSAQLCSLGEFSAAPGGVTSPASTAICTPTTSLRSPPSGPRSCTCTPAPTPAAAGAVLDSPLLPDISLFFGSLLSMWPCHGYGVAYVVRCVAPSQLSTRTL